MDYIDNVYKTAILMHLCYYSVLVNNNNLEKNPNFNSYVHFIN